MHIARIFQPKMSLFAAFFLIACGGSQTPAPAPTTSPSSAATVEAGSDAPMTDAQLDALAAGDAGSSTSTFDASAPITTTSSAPSAADPCDKPSAEFEATVRPKFNECYQEGKKKNPDLTGEIRVTVTIDYKGKIVSIKSTGPDDLGKSVIACDLAAVKKTPFLNADACIRKSIIVGKKFGVK
jgi:hypothetical protein